MIVINRVIHYKTKQRKNKNYLLDAQCNVSIKKSHRSPEKNLHLASIRNKASYRCLFFVNSKISLTKLFRIEISKAEEGVVDIN